MENDGTDSNKDGVSTSQLVCLFCLDSFMRSLSRLNNANAAEHLQYKYDKNVSSPSSSSASGFSSSIITVDELLLATTCSNDSVSSSEGYVMIGQGKWRLTWYSPTNANRLKSGYLNEYGCLNFTVINFMWYS